MANFKTVETIISFLRPHFRYTKYLSFYSINIISSNCIYIYIYTRTHKNAVFQYSVENYRNLTCKTNERLWFKFPYLDDVMGRLFPRGTREHKNNIKNSIVFC